MNAIKKMLDEKVPNWRKSAKCPVCRKKLIPTGVSQHLAEAHGIQGLVIPDMAEVHRQATGHGYSREVVTGKWKCDRCPAKGK